MNRRSLIVLLLVGTIAIAGCAHYPLNAPLAYHTPSEGHRFPAMDLNKPDPADELFVCFSFSGGGTRAAAFAYGALVKLRDTNIGRGGAGPSLLDEVDCIAGISGGAFTAAYYGLFGAKQTFEKFHDVFLGRDIQGELALRAASPPNFWRLASPYFGRIDLAAELYDQTVFEGKTFAALPKRPFVILHATNMANGSRFEFTQDVFDFMGSALAPFPVGRAVAAASAFPFLLSPVSLRSYPPPADFARPLDVSNAIQSREANMARYYWARHLEDLVSTGDKWVHLLDGGLSDNIGLRSILTSYDRTSSFIRQRINAGHIKRLVVIAVNARTDPPERLSRQERSPGLVEVFMKTTTVSMENVSFDTIDYAVSRRNERDQAQLSVNTCNDALSRCGAPLLPTFATDIRTCFVELDFEALPASEREWFLSLPTTFSLPEATVKKLIDAAGILLDGSEGFQKLLRALRGETTRGAGVGERGNCS